MKKSLEENTIALGAAFGVVFGIILGAAIDNVGLGIALGAGVGSTLKNKSKWLLGIFFWREGFEAAFGPERMGRKGFFSEGLTEGYWIEGRGFQPLP